MDEGVQLALIDLFESFRDGAMGIITAALPIAGVVLVTSVVVFFSIRFVTRFFHQG